jgi:hypothetical protein
MSAYRHLSTAKRRQRLAARQSGDTDSPARSSAYAASLRDTNLVKGRVQREGEVVHLVANHLTDLSAELATVGECDAGFPLPRGRGDDSITAVRGSIRAACRRRARSRGTSTCRTCTSTAKVKTRDFK